MDMGNEERDDLYNDAKELVLATRRVSASLIQRRLRVGYTRAVFMLRQMELDGIVGPSKDGFRELLVKPQP